MPFRSTARRPAMLDRTGGRRHRPDYMLVLFSVVLLAVGLIVIYAISPGLSAQRAVGENYYVTKQVTAIGLGLVTFLVAARMNLSAWKHAQRAMIIAAVIAAVAVQLFGEEVNGAARWVHIGGLSFQAVELIKFAVLVWLAGFLTDRVSDQTLNSTEKTFKPIMISLALVGIVVAVLQSDLGSTGVIAAMIGAMCFVAGLPLKRVLLFGGIIAIGTVLAISSSSYRRDRLTTFLSPEKDCQNTGYQACQALIAIGSGGMFGRGVGQSVQAYGYTPEAANDSIFAIYGEMFGFVGALVLIGLFIALFSRIKTVIEKAPDMHTRLLITGILAWLSTQALINIGAMIGLLPLKGITLPFISYGGTSIIFVTAAIGLVFNVSRYTSYGVNNFETVERRAGHRPSSENNRVPLSYVTRRRES